MTGMPRNDPDAEAGLLGVALLNADAVDQCWFLRAEHFWNPAHREIWMALTELRARSQVSDVIAVASLLRSQNRLAKVGGSPYLGELINAPVIGNAEAMARTVQRWARIRTAQHEFSRLAVEAREQPIPDPVDWLREAQHAAITATSDEEAERETSSTYAELASGALTEAAAAAKGPGFQGRPTGFAALDEHTGGLCPGDLWIVAGRPGHGKTAAAQQAAESVAACDALVVFFELEMSRGQLGQRSLARRAQYPLSNIRSGRIAADRWSELAAASKALAELPIIVDDAQALTPARIRAKLRTHVAAARRKWGPIPLGLVVIDHVQLTRGDNREANRYEALTETSGALKAMAKEFQVPVMALSQLNRASARASAKERRPQLSDLRETGALEQDADNVLFVHREDEYRPMGERDGTAEFILAKGRSCGSANFDLRFSGPYTLFWEENP